MRILIAEDDQTSSKYLEKAMKKYGSVTSVKDGVEAVEAFIKAHEDQDPYDLLLLDVMMPKVDGIKVLKTVREIEESRKIVKEEQVKVLIVSALEKTSYVMSGLTTDHEHYLSKPVTPTTIHEALVKLLLVKG